MTKRLVLYNCDQLWGVQSEHTVLHIYHYKQLTLILFIFKPTANHVHYSNYR